jgi:hypothetical protein
VNDRVSVGTSYADTGFILCLVFGPAGLLGGALLLKSGTNDGQLFGPFLGGLGLILLVIAFARAAYLAAGRKWLTDTDRGFVLTAHGREHKFEDEDVLELAAKVSTRFANGLPKANTRAGTLRIDSPAFPRPVAFKYEWPLNAEDPLIDLFERLLNRLTKQAEGELARDGELVGDGWALTRDGLELPAADEFEVVRFERMTAAEVVDGKVCVWASGEPRPVLSVALDTPNAPVLLQVLEKRLADRPPDENDDPESLGRVIFERNTSNTPATMFLGLMVASCLFLLGLAVLFFYVTGNPGARPPLGLAIGLNCAGVGLALGLWLGRQNILRCHARGVCRLKNGKVTEMRYDEMAQFTYSATRHYHNGAYTGTVVVMQFEAIDGRQLKYTTNIKNADDGLDNLRDHVGRVVAAGMKRRIDAGKVVRWTDRAEFEPDGIAVAGKSGLFGKQADAFVEWADVEDVRLDQGKFALFVRGRNQPVYETNVATPNFFPGFYLILLVCFPPRGEEE